jgi:uncharacterized membrane protein
MTYGMLQLLAVGFEGNKFSDRIVPELDALRENGLLRVIDLVFVTKDAEGTVDALQASDLTDDQKVEWGMSVGGLIGLGAGGMEGAEAGAEAGALNVLEGNFGLSEEDIEEIAEEVPVNCSALLILVEHLWSIPFKEALINSQGRLMGNWIIQPEMLVEMGAELEAAREAEQVGTP